MVQEGAVIQRRAALLHVAHDQVANRAADQVVRVDDLRGRQLPSQPHGMERGIGDLRDASYEVPPDADPTSGLAAWPAGCMAQVHEVVEGQLVEVTAAVQHERREGVDRFDALELAKLKFRSLLLGSDEQIRSKGGASLAVENRR